MPDQATKAKQFKALHTPGTPLILFNVWDAGSAKAVTAANAQAIATGSWSVAAAHGLDDGEQLSLQLAIANLERIVAVTELPVSIDVESGYEDPAYTIAQTIKAGAIGCNVEDSFPSNGMLRDVAEQAARIQAARAAANALGVDYFINARTDVFFQKGDGRPDSERLQCVIERAKTYATAGANGIFVPGLTDLKLVAQLTAQSPLPVNLMLSDSASQLAYAQAGAARLSYGPTPYRLVMQALESEARKVLGR